MSGIPDEPRTIDDMRRALTGSSATLEVSRSDSGNRATVTIHLSDAKGSMHVAGTWSILEDDTVSEDAYRVAIHISDVNPA